MAIAEPIEAFMEHRRSLGIDQPWAYLHALSGTMRTTSCACPSCGESR